MNTSNGIYIFYLFPFPFVVCVCLVSISSWSPDWVGLCSRLWITAANGRSKTSSVPTWSKWSTFWHRPTVSLLNCCCLPDGPIFYLSHSLSFSFVVPFFFHLFMSKSHLAPHLNLTSADKDGRGGGVWWAQSYCVGYCLLHQTTDVGR